MAADACSRKASLSKCYPLKVRDCTQQGQPGGQAVSGRRNSLNMEVYGTFTAGRKSQGLGYQSQAGGSATRESLESHTETWAPF